LQRFYLTLIIEGSEPPVVDDDFVRAIAPNDINKKETRMIIYISPAVLNRLLSLLPWLLPLLLSGDALPFL
jgi:fructose-1-phosphate kinase PfkB-like protein